MYGYISAPNIVLLHDEGQRLVYVHMMFNNCPYIVYFTGFFNECFHIQSLVNCAHVFEEWALLTFLGIIICLLHVQEVFISL